MCVEHHFREADCINPETCEICGKIQGNPKGHAWKEADCVNPEKCEVCGMTQGVSLGHSWADATCSNPKECTVCHLTNGEPLGHITRLGKCSRCGEFQKELFDEFMLIRQYADSATQYVESANNEINEKNMSSLSNATEHVYLCVDTMKVLKQNIKKRMIVVVVMLNLLRSKNY